MNQIASINLTFLVLREVLTSMDPESSGRFPSTFDMTSSSKEQIKMVLNRGTAGRIWVMENYCWLIDIVVSFYVLLSRC